MTHFFSMCYVASKRLPEWQKCLLFFFLQGSGDSLLVCLKSKKASSHGELSLQSHVKNAARHLYFWHFNLLPSAGSWWIYLPFLCHIRTCEPSFSFWVFGSQAAPQWSLYHLQGENGHNKETNVPVHYRCWRHMKRCIIICCTKTWF